MKVLVTGSNGLIGNAIVNRIRETNLDLITHTRRKESAIQNTNGIFFDSSLIDQIVLPRDIDCIIHTATSNENNIKDVKLTLSSTILGTLNLVQKAIEFNVKRFIYISTTQVYETALEIDEDSRVNAKSQYALQHLVTEKALQLCAPYFSGGVTILRVANVFSDSEIALTQRNNLVPTCFVVDGLRDKVIKLKTNGNQRKSFIHDGSLAKIAVEEITKNEKLFKVCNVASQFTPSILEIANLVASKIKDIGGHIIVKTNTMDFEKASNLIIKSLYRDLPSYEEQEMLLHRSLETLIQKEMSK
jgi:nucleoside-diphosphate-sugar epimerase